MSLRTIAARICLTAPPLIGVDGLDGGLCSEAQVAAGLVARWNAAEVMLTDGASVEAVSALVNCEGACGPDRMIALWWSALRLTGCARPGALAQLLPSLDRPAADLIAAGRLAPWVWPAFSPPSDPWADARRRARAQLAAAQDEIRRAALLEEP